MENMYDVIVVGGGHAGIEASLISARLHKKTLLITLSIENIGKMPCNPSIGGPAKGIVVKEIDALGGQMGITADKTALQFKMLNTTKGPGVQCLRVQSDKLAYKKMMQEEILKQDNLDVLEGIAQRCIIEDNKIIGIEMDGGTKVYGKITILTTGTYMASNIMISDEVTNFGPDNEPTTLNLSQSLRDAGLKTFRLKTGTPPRVLTSSIDFSKTSLQPGTDEFVCFSDTTTQIRSFDKQLPCYLTYTNSNTHKIIMDNLHRSSMYSGVVKGVGPRYCPSIEDKLVRFKDKERHQLFLEPESEALDTTYVQGFSTSLPREIQEKMVHSLAGLENCIIKKYAYAIEYDAIDPLQMKPSLESKIIENLFTAGQINGTSGYEEAAGQGLIAGINACLKLDGKEPLILSRDEAYIGVLIDDLVTKGTKEPYRLLTSRAEFRLLLRHDNADQRLIEKGYKIGTISKERYDAYCLKMQKIKDAKELLANTKVSAKSKGNEYLISLGYDGLNDSMSALDLVKRPLVKTYELAKAMEIDIEERIAKQVDIEVKYAGYIEKEAREAARLQKMDKTLIPEDIDYEHMENLSLEGKQKLMQVRPRTVGQASRISGVNPADIAILAMMIKRG